jgi:MFS family permease
MTSNTEAVPETGGGRARIGRVLRNRQVRRVQVAFAGSTLGDWAYTTAVIVWAYTDGGAAAVGAYQAVRFLAMAVAAPLGGALADRMSRRTFMLVADAARAVLVALAATIVVADGPAVAVYTLAVVAAIVGAPFRAAQAGLLPELVDSPGDLAAANALSANLENVMLFAGPALAGVLIGVWNVEAVFWLNVATFVWSILFVLGVRAGSRPDTSEPDDAPGHGFLRDFRAGFGLVVGSKDLRGIALLSAATGFTWGALTVVMVVLATSPDVLDSGPEAVGYFNATLGIATVVGGVVVLTRVGRNRLGEDMILANLGWGVPLLVLAAFPSPATAFAAVAVIGLSESLGGLGFETLPQRIAPAEFVSRVYSAIGSALTGSMFLGALVAPLLVDHAGVRTALLVAGTVVLAVTVPRWAQMRALDQRLQAPAELALLGRISTFADLPGPALEMLAHTSERVAVPAGTVVMAEGDASSRFYVIVSGRVEVTQGGEFRRTEGPGEVFGEIGLLRDVPRTATVTTVEDSEFQVVERPDFLAAVGNLGDARGTLDDLVVRRLAS